MFPNKELAPGQILGVIFGWSDCRGFPLTKPRDTELALPKPTAGSANFLRKFPEIATELVPDSSRCQSARPVARTSSENLAQEMPLAENFNAAKGGRVQWGP